MEIKYGRVFYNADDEEPDCGMCDNQEGDLACDNCGSEYCWRYYRREELDLVMIDLIKGLKNLGAR